MDGSAPGPRWQPPERLEDAADRRPRFLYFHAEWCSWCRRLEAETLARPEVAARLSRDFLPVRVDADRRRTLFLRLGGRGLPFVVLLDADGRPLADFTGLVDAPTLLAWLDQPHAPGPATARKPAVDPARWFEALDEAWDPASGLFANPTLAGIQGVKHPQPLTLRLLLRSCLPPGPAACPCPDPVWGERLPHALERLRRTLQDPADGGFRYYADPETGHLEEARRLERNLRLAGLFLEGCRRLRRPAFCRSAVQAAGFLRRVLWNPATGAFRSDPPPLGDRSPPDPAANAQAFLLLLDLRGAPRQPAPGSLADRLGRRLAARLEEDSLPEALQPRAWLATLLAGCLEAETELPGLEGRTATVLRALLDRILAEHRLPDGGLSELPAAAGDPFTHPAGNGLVARLLVRLPPRLLPADAPTLLPGLLATQTWRPGIDFDDLAPGVEAACGLQAVRQEGFRPPTPAP